MTDKTQEWVKDFQDWWEGGTSEINRAYAWQGYLAARKKAEEEVHIVYSDCNEKLNKAQVEIEKLRAENERMSDEIGEHEANIEGYIKDKIKLKQLLKTAVPYVEFFIEQCEGELTVWINDVRGGFWNE